MPYGTLLLIIVDGRNLKDMVFSLSLFLCKTSNNTLQDLFGKMDPYVNFQLAADTNVRARWRCKTHMGGGKTPSWNDRHSFDVVEGDDRIQAQCYDEDQGNSDDLIGMVSIDLNPVFDSGIRDEWFPLQASLHLDLCVCLGQHYASEPQWQAHRRNSRSSAVHSYCYLRCAVARRRVASCLQCPLRRFSCA